MCLVCDELKQGLFAISAPGWHNSIFALDSVAKRMHLPYVDWLLPPRVIIDARSNHLSKFSVSIRPPIDQLLADWIVYKQWQHVIFMQDGIDGKLI